MARDRKRGGCNEQAIREVNWCQQHSILCLILRRLRFMIYDVFYTTFFFGGLFGWGVCVCIEASFGRPILRIEEPARKSLGNEQSMNTIFG